jgi:hypothetical protein
MIKRVVLVGGMILHPFAAQGSGLQAGAGDLPAQVLCGTLRHAKRA